jgi:hypothetical protein
MIVYSTAIILENRENKMIGIHFCLTFLKYIRFLKQIYGANEGVGKGLVIKVVTQENDPSL